MGNLLDAERVTREDEHFPKRVANFLKEVRLPENSGRSSTCATALTWSTDLTHHLCSNNMSKLIHELYGQPDGGAAGGGRPDRCRLAPRTLCARSSSRCAQRKKKEAAGFA